MAKTINLNFDSMGKDELRSACKAAGVTGYGKLSNLQMRDALKAAYAEPQVAPQDVATDATPVESAPAKPAVAAPKDQRNGITRPGAGTACRAIWDLLDQLKADGKELTFATLRAGIDPKVADATLRTQRQRWNHFTA